jgi:hypothetical protein
MEVTVPRLYVRLLGSGHMHQWHPDQLGTPHWQSQGPQMPWLAQQHDGAQESSAAMQAGQELTLHLHRLHRHLQSLQTNGNQTGGNGYAIHTFI